jgi:hypothetical protein
MFDRFTGLTSAPQQMPEFPEPTELRSRYEEGMGFNLESPEAKPLLTPYTGGDTRTPDELLDIIEAKGKEITEALGNMQKNH